jgi:integrase
MLSHRARGVGIKTSNNYLGSIKAFTCWLIPKRSPADLLHDMQALNADTDRRHERRALTVAELNRFLEAAATGKVFRGLDGPARIVLYCVGARTGLRASELASLTPDSLDLTARPPTVTVEAGYSKRRRRDVLPLRSDTAELLRAYCVEMEPEQLLWPGTWPEAGAEMIRFDLETAGIPYRDRQDRILDFHGLRHTFLTHMASSGIHPKVAQLLARQSTISLTMDRYTHLDVLDLAGDLDRLSPVVPRPQVQEQRKQA